MSFFSQIKFTQSIVDFFSRSFCFDLNRIEIFYWVQVNNKINTFLIIQDAIKKVFKEMTNSQDLNLMRSHL